MWKIERARSRDFDEVMAFLDNAFGMQPGWFLHNLSHVYSRRDKWMRCNRIIRDGATLAGVFGIFPMRFVADGATLTGTGIGGVSTRPDYRGRGIMSAFLTDACRELRENGDDISILWGKRERYGRYGWETAGARLNLSLPADAPWRQAGKGVRALNLARDLEPALAAYSRLAVRVQRDAAQMRACLQRRKFQFVVSDKTTPFACVGFRKEKGNRVAEMAGDVDGVENILRWLAQKNGRVEAAVYDRLDPITARVRELAANCGAAPLGSIKIVNLASTMRKLLPVINRNLAPLSATGKLTLRMTGTDQAVTLAFEGKARIATDAAGATVVTLTDRQLARLIFGCGGCGLDFPLRGKAALLKHILPVPLYAHEPDHV